MTGTRRSGRGDGHGAFRTLLQEKGYPNVVASNRFRASSRPGRCRWSNRHVFHARGLCSHNTAVPSVSSESFDIMELGGMHRLRDMQANDEACVPLGIADAL